MAFEGLFFSLFLSIIFLILAALYKHYKKTKKEASHWLEQWLYCPIK